jgi:hypothetical protein
MQLLDPALRVHVIHADAVIETSNDQLLPHHVSPINWNLVATDLVLVPEEDQLVLIASHQDRVQHQTHAHCLLVVACMLHHDVEGLALDQQAGCVVADEDGGGLQVQEGDWLCSRTNGQMEDVGSRDESDCSIGLAEHPAAIEEVAGGSDELLLGRCEDVLFGVRVDA